MRERAIATVLVWITYLAMVWLSIDKLDTWAIALAFVMVLPLIIIMGGMWGMFNADKKDADDMAVTTDKKQHLSDDELEKRKRDRIDNVLRDLSDDDLGRLRERLSDGTIDDDHLYHMLGDDGEIIYRTEEK